MSATALARLCPTAAANQPQRAPRPLLKALVHRIDYDALADRAMMQAINRLIDTAPGIWFYDCFNAEYLFHPFCETCNIREMLAFHTQERCCPMSSTSMPMT